MAYYGNGRLYSKNMRPDHKRARLLLMLAAKSLLKRDPQRLPEVSVILDLRTPELWFPINGMYGGFSLRFNLSDQPALIAASWCRVVGGSGEKHLITAEAITLIDSGFV